MLVDEKLTKLYGIQLSVESIRQMIIWAGCIEFD
jgi:hypothetical protein